MRENVEDDEMEKYLFKRTEVMRGWRKCTFQLGQMPQRRSPFCNRLEKEKVLCMFMMKYVFWIGKKRSIERGKGME